MLWSAQQEFLYVVLTYRTLKCYLGQVNNAVFWTYQHVPRSPLEVILLGKLLTGALGILIQYILVATSESASSDTMQ